MTKGFEIRKIEPVAEDERGITIEWKQLDGRQ